MFRTRQRRSTGYANGKEEDDCVIPLTTPVPPLFESPTKGKQNKVSARSRILGMLALFLFLSHGIVILVNNAVSFPQLGPIPSEPRKASATLFTESNECYDIALQAFLHGWTLTASTQPMLVLHSIPLPDKVARFIATHPDRIRAIPVAERGSRLVINPRWRKCATKFVIWDQTDYDILAYYDVDHMFSSKLSDDVFEVVQNNKNDAGSKNNDNSPPLLYGVIDSKRQKEFNGGHLFIRPSRAIYDKLNYLYDWRFLFIWILGGDIRDAFLSGDQRYLNVVLHGRWLPIDRPRFVKHSKLWKVATYPMFNGTNWQQDARHFIDELDLRNELKTCIGTEAASVASKDRSLVSYWFND